MLLPCGCVAVVLLAVQVYTVTLHGEQLKTDFRVINTGDKVGWLRIVLGWLQRVTDTQDCCATVCKALMARQAWCGMSLTLSACASISCAHAVS